MLHHLTTKIITSFDSIKNMPELQFISDLNNVTKNIITALLLQIDVIIAKIKVSNLDIMVNDFFDNCNKQYEDDAINTAIRELFNLLNISKNESSNIFDLKAIKQKFKDYFSGIDKTNHANRINRIIDEDIIYIVVVLFCGVLSKLYDNISSFDRNIYIAKGSSFFESNKLDMSFIVDILNIFKIINLFNGLYDLIVRVFVELYSDKFNIVFKKISDIINLCNKILVSKVSNFSISVFDNEINVYNKFITNYYDDINRYITTIQRYDLYKLNIFRQYIDDTTIDNVYNKKLIQYFIDKQNYINVFVNSNFSNNYKLINKLLIFVKYLINKKNNLVLIHVAHTAEKIFTCIRYNIYRYIELYHAICDNIHGFSITSIKEAFTDLKIVDDYKMFTNSLQEYSDITNITESQNNLYNTFKNVLQNHLHINGNSITLNAELDQYKNILNENDIVNILIKQCNEIIKIISNLKIKIDEIIAKMPKDESAPQ
jgi:hypothetical protein